MIWWPLASASTMVVSLRSLPKRTSPCVVRPSSTVPEAISPVPLVCPVLALSIANVVNASRPFVLVIVMSITSPFESQRELLICQVPVKEPDSTGIAPTTLVDWPGVDGAALVDGAAPCPPWSCRGLRIATAIIAMRITRTRAATAMR